MVCLKISHLCNIYSETCSAIDIICTVIMLSAFLTAGGGTRTWLTLWQIIADVNDTDNCNLCHCKRLARTRHFLCLKDESVESQVSRGALTTYYISPQVSDLVADHYSLITLLYKKEIFSFHLIWTKKNCYIFCFIFWSI